MIVYEKLKEAESIVLKSVDIPMYYKKNIDGNVDLFDTHVNCPLHDDSTASFQYHEETDTFYCFGCRRGGNVIVLHRFIMKQEIGEDDDKGRITYSKALLDLAGIFDIEIPSFYSKDLKGELPIKLNTVKPIQLTGVSERFIVSKVERLLTKLKHIDMPAYSKICSYIDSLPSMYLSPEEKVEAYTKVYSLINQKIRS